MPNLVSPRLSEAAGEIFAEIIRAQRAKGGLTSVRAEITFEHRDAAPVETGQPITKSQLQSLRNSVLRHFNTKPERMSPRALDLTLGRALVSELPFVRSDLLHGGTWSFLTLCVFPDLLCIRWPDFNKDRALGTPRRRNVLQRVWVRESMLGPLIHQPGVELAEDEYEQIVGRSSVARVPGLPLLMGEALVRAKPTGRPEIFARTVGKMLVHQTGVLLLDALSQEELKDLLAEVTRNAAREVFG